MRGPRKRNTPIATLEVRMVPKREEAGFLWSYVWTIELRPNQAQQLYRLVGNSTRAAVRSVVRRIVRSAAARGLPFGPGSLADYELMEEQTVLRFNVG